MSKIKMGQVLIDLQKNPVPFSQMADPQTLALVQMALKECPPEVRLPAIEQINKSLAEPLTLRAAVAHALLAPPPDRNEFIKPEDRSKRLELAIRLNSNGMRKVAQSDIDVIAPCVEKIFRDALISTQVKILLQGKAFTVDPEDEPEDPAAGGTGGETPAG